MKIAYGFLGLKPNEFWRLTLAEIKTMVEGKQDYEKAIMKREKWLIWNAEALHRQKRLVSLQSYLSEQKGTRVIEGEKLDKTRKQHDEIINAYNKARG